MKERGAGIRYFTHRAAFNMMLTVCVILNERFRFVRLKIFCAREKFPAIRQQPDGNKPQA